MNEKSRFKTGTSIVLIGSVILLIAFPMLEPDTYEEHELATELLGAGGFLIVFIGLANVLISIFNIDKKSFHNIVNRITSSLFFIAVATCLTAIFLILKQLVGF